MPSAMFISSHVHNPEPHGSRVRVANRPRDRVPFTTLFKATGLGSVVAVSGLQVRQVEDLQLEVLEVMVAVRLLDQPADLVVEPFDRGVRCPAELPEAEDARKVFLYRDAIATRSSTSVACASRIQSAKRPAASIFAFALA